MHYRQPIFFASILVLPAVLLWVFLFLNENEQSTVLANSTVTTMTEPGYAATTLYELPDPPKTSFENPTLSANHTDNTNAVYPLQESIDEILPAHLAAFDVLLEIGIRIAVEQVDEAENELNALVSQLNKLSDDEKLAFLNFFVNHMINNVFNPEAVMAFDQLWSMLDMNPSTRLAAATLLGPHYLDSYEFEFAIQHFNTISQLAGGLDSVQSRDISHAYFQLHQYQQVIGYILDHIEAQTTQNGEVARREYSHLFEAYYRTGNYDDAETIGLFILGRYADVQDWKDMQQFYESINDREGLDSHLNQARAGGLLGQDSDWID